MIYNKFKKFVFIHIPRSSGTSMTMVLHTVFPESFVEDLSWKHAVAYEIRKIIIGRFEWDTYFKFAIMRSPWEIIESMYKHLVIKTKEPLNPDIMIASQWIKTLERFAEYKTFEEYVQNEFIRYSGVNHFGGFYGTYCLDANNDLGVHVYQYSELEKAWEDICSRLDIKNTKYPKVNASTTSTPLWTKDLVEEIAEVCKLDIEKFGYQPPKVR